MCTDTHIHTHKHIHTQTHTHTSIPSTIEFGLIISYTISVWHTSLLGTDRPALKYLYAHVRGNIANDWYDIGVALLDPGDEVVLDTINNNHPGDSEKCAAKMLKLWLDRKPGASWDQLLEALREPNIKLNTLATKIEEILSEGMCNF